MRHTPQLKWVHWHCERGITSTELLITPSQGSNLISSHAGLLPNTSPWSLSGWLGSAHPANAPALTARSLAPGILLTPLAPWLSYIARVSGTKPFLTPFRALPASSYLGEAVKKPSHFAIVPVSFLPQRPFPFILILSNCRFIFRSQLSSMVLVFPHHWRFAPRRCQFLLCAK